MAKKEEEKEQKEEAKKLKLEMNKNPGLKATEIAE
jgi:hypothetical protein